MRLFKRTMLGLSVVLSLGTHHSQIQAHDRAIEHAPEAAKTSLEAMLQPTLKPGGGDLNPGIYADEASMTAFQDMKIGLSVHWGPSSLGGKEISWSRGEQISKEIYDNYYRAFNPTKFDAQAWMDLMHEGGMKYIMLTSKHHDGFALWDSAYSTYDIASTPFKRSIVGEIVDAAKENDIVFGTYFSTIDWYHPDYQPYDHGGPGSLYETDASTPNFERYRMFMKAQMRELIQDFGAKIIQVDGEWDPTWNHDVGSHLYAYLRLLDPTIIINNRVDVGREHLNPDTNMWEWQRYAGDFDERERMVDWVQKESQVFGRSINPWQAWVTIDQAQWSYNETPRLLALNEIIVDLVKTIGDGGNYLINLGPKPDGSFDETQAQMVRDFGEWVKAHSEAIYGTRAGPLLKEGAYTSTKKSNADGIETVYVFAFEAETLDAIDLAGFKPNSVQTLSGTELNFKIEGTQLNLDLPADESGAPISVFKLQ